MLIAKLEEINEIRKYSIIIISHITPFHSTQNTTNHIT